MLIHFCLFNLLVAVVCVGEHVRNDDKEARHLMKTMRMKRMHTMKMSKKSSSFSSFGMISKSKGEMSKSKGDKKSDSFKNSKGGYYSDFRGKKSNKRDGKGYKGRPQPRPRTTATPTSEQTTPPTIPRMPTTPPTNATGLNPIGTWVQQGSTMILDFEGQVPFAGFVPIDVSADGNTVAMLLSNLVQVYRYDDTVGDWSLWGQTLSIPGEALSLSAGGTKLAVSLSSGHIRVYEYDDRAADPFQSWIPMGPDIQDRSAPGEVALSADGFTLVAGGIGYRATQPIRVYQYNANNIEWIQIGQDITDGLGGDVDISADGTIIAVGFPSFQETGFARVYQYDADLDFWSPLGQTIQGTEDFGRAGTSVALSGNGYRIVVSEPGAGNGGEVYVYEYDNATQVWNPLGPSMEQINPFTFDTGTHVATSSDGSIVTYGPYGNGRPGEQHVAVFQYDAMSDQWVQIGQSLLDGDLETDWLAPYFISVALSSTGSILVTSSLEDFQTDTGFTTEGRVRVFAYK